MADFDSINSTVKNLKLPWVNFKEIRKMIDHKIEVVRYLLCSSVQLQKSFWLSVEIYFISRNPISEYPFYVLVETHGSDESHDADKLNKFLTKEMESGLILDGTVTSEPSKMQVSFLDLIVLDKKISPLLHIKHNQNLSNYITLLQIYLHDTCYRVYLPTVKY